MTDVLTILLAGGAGQRLYPLTRYRAKPAVPFGGIYRIIDITLSNCVNSGLRQIFILTQHKAVSLNRHIRDGWNILSPELGEFTEILPPTMQTRDTWYLGTADAVFQNLGDIIAEDPKFVLILSADQVYKMNYQQLLAFHQTQNADVTVATTRVAPDEAARFGIVEVDETSRVTAFEEKPTHGFSARSPADRDYCCASMGIYLFSTPTLIEILERDAANPDSSHDFGNDVLPGLASTCRVAAYDFVDENKKDVRYWRDIGTIDAYYEANMDLVSVSPVFNLYDQDWPIRTNPSRYPPAKFVFAEEGRRMGLALDSLVAHGCIVSGGRVVHSILSPGVRINSFSLVERSILFENVHIGWHCRFFRTIIESNVSLPDYTAIGYDAEADRRAGHLVTDSGITVVCGEQARNTHLAEAKEAPAA